MLPKAGAGGPKNLGDPNDRTLRRVEVDVLIPKKVRERTKDEKCMLESQAFSDCCKVSGFFMFIKCRKNTKELNKCLEKWYHDEGFKKECTEEYLKERAEYRRTGLTQKQRRKESSMF